MQLSIKYKFAFLCIPKCGSTSVERAIAPYCETNLGGHPTLKHLSAGMFNSHIRPLLRRADPNHEIETFCIMRDPMDRVRSWYQYRSRPELRDVEGGPHHRYTGGMSFTEFVEFVIAGKLPESAGVGSQAKFVSLRDGSIGVDRIFRLDQMDILEDYLSAKVGKKITIPVVNKSVSKTTTVKAGEFNLPDDVTTRLRARLQDDYAIYNHLPWSASSQPDRPNPDGLQR